MKVKDLRKLLRGVDGNAEISSGNYSGYSPRIFGETMNVFFSDLSIIKEDKTKVNEDIKKVILWFEE